jgi:hypothetical protein
MLLIDDATDATDDADATDAADPPCPPEGLEAGVNRHPKAGGVTADVVTGDAVATGVGVAGVAGARVVPFIVPFIGAVSAACEVTVFTGTADTRFC